MPEVHLAFAKTGAEGEERKTIRDHEEDSSGHRESGGAMEGIALVHLESGDAVRADCFLALAQRGQLEERVAIGAGKPVGDSERMHEGNG